MLNLDKNEWIRIVKKSLLMAGVFTLIMFIMKRYIFTEGSQFYGFYIILFLIMACIYIASNMMITKNKKKESIK